MLIFSLSYVSLSPSVWLEGWLTTDGQNTGQKAHSLKYLVPDSLTWQTFLCLQRDLYITKPLGVPKSLPLSCILQTGRESHGQKQGVGGGEWNPLAQSV